MTKSQEYLGWFEGLVTTVSLVLFLAGTLLVQATNCGPVIGCDLRTRVGCSPVYLKAALSLVAAFFGLVTVDKGWSCLVRLVRLVRLAGDDSR